MNSNKKENNFMKIKYSMLALIIILTDLIIYLNLIYEVLQLNINIKYYYYLLDF